MMWGAFCDEKSDLHNTNKVYKVYKANTTTRVETSSTWISTHMGPNTVFLDKIVRNEVLT
jgi:hypothetical protein